MRRLRPCDGVTTGGFFFAQRLATIAFSPAGAATESACPLISELYGFAQQERRERIEARQRSRSATCPAPIAWR